jgi:hypothetical protein
LTRIIAAESLQCLLSRPKKGEPSVLLRVPQRFAENLALDIFVDMLQNAEE